MTKIPYFSLSRIKMLAYLCHGTYVENRGDFDFETSMMAVALLANSRASHAARSASSFTFRTRVLIKT